MQNLLADTMAKRQIDDVQLAAKIGRCRATVTGARTGSRQPGPTVVQELARALELNEDRLGQNIYQVRAWWKKQQAALEQARAAKRRERAELAAQPLLVSFPSDKIRAEDREALEERLRCAKRDAIERVIGELAELRARARSIEQQLRQVMAPPVAAGDDTRMAHAETR